MCVPHPDSPSPLSPFDFTLYSVERGALQLCDPQNLSSESLCLVGSCEKSNLIHL